MSKTKKKNITIKFYIFNTDKGPNSIFNWQFWFFWTKLTQKSCFQSKEKKKETKRQNHHPILHIQISVSSKFQLQQTILIFWKEFSKKGYFWSKQKKKQYHHWILHIQISPSIKLRFKLTNFFFAFVFSPKKIFYVSNKLNENQHQILHIWIRLFTEFSFKLTTLIFLDQTCPKRVSSHKQKRWTLPLNSGYLNKCRYQISV